jgi:hypothetical protein
MLSVPLPNEMNQAAACSSMMDKTEVIPGQKSGSGKSWRVKSWLVGKPDKSSPITSHGRFARYSSDFPIFDIRTFPLSFVGSS